MHSPDHEPESPNESRRSARTRRPLFRRPPERIVLVLGTVVPPLFQVQVPWCAAAPALAFLALTALWR